MSKNIEYTNRYVDGLSESEAKETLKRILNERFVSEKAVEIDKVHKQISAMYIADNRKEINIEIPKLKF